MPVDIDKFYAELEQYPEQEIIGVVCPSGVRGSRGGGESMWDLSLTLEAWRDSTGALHQEELYIWGKLTEADLLELRDQLPPYQVTKLLLRVGENTHLNRLEAVFLRILEMNATDPELAEIAAELQRPVTLSTNRFGILTLDRRIKWFEGKVRLGLRKVKLSLEPEDIADTDGVLASAEKLWDSIQHWDKLAREKAQVEMLEIKNGSWLSDGEAPMTASQFKSRMKLESVIVGEDEDIAFWYEDGDIFWGHSIEVSGNLEDGFDYAAFHG